MRHFTEEFIIESDNTTLACTYEIKVSRKQDSDSQGRKWWVPSYNAGLVSAILSTDDSEYEWEFGSGDDMHALLKKEMKECDGELTDAIEERVKEIVNDPHYTDNPNKGEPRDD